MTDQRSQKRQDDRKTRREWTVPDCTGRTAVVTGATSGVGFEVAKRLARAGARVVLAVRNPDKGRASLDAIRAEVQGAAVEQERLDVASLASVRDFTRRLAEAGAPVDILVNNAGIMDVPRREVTPDGFELQLATNFLGHFALTAGLLDALRASSGGGRVVNLGSLAVNFPTTRLDLADLQLQRRYSGMRAYGQSKLAALLFAFELGRRSGRGSWGVTSTAAHPGSCTTNLQVTGKRFGEDTTKRPVNATTLVMRVPGLHQGADQGALPVLRAATDPGARSGDYFGPSRNFEAVGAPGHARVPRAARDPRLAAGLWERAVELTGARWPGAGAAQGPAPE
ncbi:SDR family oxidoreductase [Streptomyces tremellae]|uniref:SDR family oxidoreductase n=1 Tax=Streptomyces tremellae TaxID=1124239 RepID=A0ABP7FCS9_9ACTN